MTTAADVGVSPLSGVSATDYVKMAAVPVIERHLGHAKAMLPAGLAPAN